jgi:cytoskeletal protein RodZ
MDLTYVSILVLAAMVFVVSGMVGYLYWQQTRLQQHVQSLSMVVASLVTPAPLEDASPESTEETEAEAEVEVEEDAPADEDDRVSVEHVTAPPADTENKVDVPVDVDDLQSKTAVQLRELLTQKGIPFGKRDSKSALIELLKATA